MSITRRSRMARKKILESLRSGAYRTHAAAAAGIHKTTFFAWLNDDPDFAQAVEAAEASAAKVAIDKLFAAANAGPQYWAAAATWMERRHPELFGRKDRLHVEHEPVQLNVAAVLINQDAAGALAQLSRALNQEIDERAPRLLTEGEEPMSGDPILGDLTRGKPLSSG